MNLSGLKLRKPLRRILLISLLAIWGEASAVERILKIDAPGSVKAGESVGLVISASTDAGQGEHVGFLQAEASVDGGKTWRAICYLDKGGVKVVQPANLTPGAAGTAVLVRVRAAFRDGLAGNVDHTGAAIRWHGSWNDWTAPAAIHASIAVKGR